MSILENDKRVKSLIPFNEIESATIKQFEELLKFDQIKKIAIMPDTHFGYFAPIGSVILVDGYVSAKMVGYDQNCGMCYLDTGISIHELIPDNRAKREVIDKILRCIPLGFNMRKEPLNYPKYESAYNKYVNMVDLTLDERINNKIGKQLGTLGGGNHYIEIGSTTAETLAICIHSGSRKAGHILAEHYWKFGDFLKDDSPIGKAFIADLKWSEEYAFINRKAMVHNVLVCLDFSIHDIHKLIENNMINESHNTVTRTKDGMWLHRKGATPAEKDQLGIIPGNMRDGTVVTRGKGNEEFLSSAPHGAGRRMSRNKAKKLLDMIYFEETMQGIETNGLSKKKLDEAPEAYKNFRKVLKQSEPVVDIIDRLTPIINIKA
jgi:tRNA-splicing ligase RtcB